MMLYGVRKEGRMSTETEACVGASSSSHSEGVNGNTNLKQQSSMDAMYVWIQRLIVPNLCATSQFKVLAAIIQLSNFYYKVQTILFCIGIKEKNGQWQMLISLTSFTRISHLLHGLTIVLIYFWSLIACIRLVKIS